MTYPAIRGPVKMFLIVAACHWLPLTVGILRSFHSRASVIGRTPARIRGISWRICSASRLLRWTRSLRQPNGVLAAVIAAFHRGVPLPVDNTPRGIPRFLVPLVHQTPRGGNSGVRSQVDIPGQAGHIQAIQLDGVDKVFQRARIPRGPVDIGHHQGVALATAQRGQDLLPLRAHYPEAERAVRELDTLPLERRDGVLGYLPVDRAPYARDTVA